MKILITGVIVGSTGRKALARYLEYLSEKDEKPDFVVANGNFAAGGIGLSEDASREMFDAGVDVITTGENVWDQKTLQDIIDTQPRILRPCNLPENSPGKGTVVVPAGPGGVPVGVINLSGYSFIQRILPDNPFPMIRGIIDTIRSEARIIIVDFFSIPSAEKAAMRHFIDGEVTALIGTGTLVMTADESVTKLGTATITDIGLVGAYDSVAGFEIQKEIMRFTTGMKVFSKPAVGAAIVNGVIIEIDETDGAARSILPIRHMMPRG
ncbi:MAG: YmdB family metallophosphoesterase [Deltaproteobacteria bacterium]|nr:YmdB family metallophosphoesterase [Candidatus Zymogenaceae bacterium]